MSRGKGNSTARAFGRRPAKTRSDAAEGRDAPARRRRPQHARRSWLGPLASLSARLTARRRQRAPHWLTFTVAGLATLSGTTVVMAVGATAAHAAGSTLPFSGSLQFEAGDGDMTCDQGAGCLGATPTYLDWSSTYVTSSPVFLNGPDTDPACTGTGKDEVFGSGTHENSTSVTVTCSSAPPKVNLTQMYAWSQTVPAVTGDTFLYLAWEAPNQSGSNNNHIDFELNHAKQPRLTGPGTLNLNRTPGDLLFDYNITPTVPLICYSTWSGSAWVFPTGGTPSSMCQSNEAILTSAVAAVNSAQFTDTVSAAGPQTIPVGGFGEMGVDLNAAGVIKAGQCANFGDIWLKSRSSGSGQPSELKSFIQPPTPFGFSTCSSTTSTTPSSSDIALGSSLTDSATVTGVSSGIGTPPVPTGTVTFYVCGPGATSCSSSGKQVGSPVNLSTGTTSGSSVTVTSPSFTPPTAGTYCFAGVYSGDTNYPGSSDGSSDECFRVDAIATSLSAGSITAGGTAHDSATLSGVTAGAGGTVTYTVYSESTCTTQATTGAGNQIDAQPATVDVTSGSVPDSASVTFNDVGTYYWRASYSGDSNNAAVKSACTSEILAVGINPTSISTKLSSSSIAVDSAVHDSATLSGGVSNPGGTVTYKVYTTSDCTVEASTGAGGDINAQPGTVTVTNGSVPDSASVTFQKTGTYYFLASYSGDANNSPSTSVCTSEQIVVNPLSPTIATSLSSGSIPVESSVHDSATLSGATPDAGGTVTYTVYSDNACSVPATSGTGADINAQPAIVTVTSGTVPNSASVTFTKAGTYYWQAAYSGDSNNNRATSPCTSETLVVNPLSPAISTSLSSSSIPVDSSAHDSATLSGATPDAGGTVTYTVYSESTCTTQATTGAGNQIDAQPATVDVTSGSVPDSASVTFNKAGTYYWQAVYSGDINNNPARSPCTSETVLVNPLSPTIATSLSASAIVVGSSAHDSATLSGATPDAGGTVTYTVYSDNTCSTPATTGAGGDLSAQPGTVTVTNGSVPDSASVTFNKAGTYYFQAVYSGDVNNNPAKSICTSETLVVLTPLLTATKTSTPAPGSTVSLGQTVTYGITLSNAGNAAATAVVVSDAVPAGTTYVAGSATCGGVTTCAVAEVNGVVTWTGISVPAQSGSTPGAVTLTFQVTVNSNDTNGQVIPNVGQFSNESTPSCTGSTCPTNTVTLTVVVPAPAPIIGVTTVHTGKPWAGSRPLELLAAVIGLGLIGLGERQRRRQRRAAVQRCDD